jgi:hypothetical protein
LLFGVIMQEVAARSTRAFKEDLKMWRCKTKGFTLSKLSYASYVKEDKITVPMSLRRVS